MNSTLNNKQHYEMNYGIDEAVHGNAAKQLRKLGVTVKEHPIMIYIVNGEYLSPATMMKRLSEGYYANEKASGGEAEERTVQGPRLSRSNRKSTRPDVQTNRVRSDSDKPVRGQGRSSGNGKRTSKAVLGRDSNLKAVARAENKMFRKSNTSVSDSPRNSRADKGRLEREVEPRASGKRSSSTRQSDMARQKPLRRSNSSRLRTASRVRRGRS